MKRYDCYYKNDFRDEYPALSKQADDGDWVLYEDAQAEIDRLRDLLRRAAGVVDGCCRCLDYNDVGKEVEQELGSTEQRSDQP